MSNAVALFANKVIFVLSGYAGAGKNAICAELAQRTFGHRHVRLHTLISGATRPMRAGERQGVDYNFMPENEFLRRRAGGEFLESVRIEVKDSETGENRVRYYGLEKSELARIPPDKPGLTHLNIDGGLAIHEICPNAVLIIVKADEDDERGLKIIEDRMVGRGDPEDKIRERLIVARDESRRIPGLLRRRVYRHVIINRPDGLTAAVEHAALIVETELDRIQSAATTA